MVSALQRAGWTSASPEAATAASVFRDVRSDLAGHLTRCASGAELLAGGFSADIAIAAELDESHTVPLLGRAGFDDAARASHS